MPPPLCDGVVGLNPDVGLARILGHSIGETGKDVKLVVRCADANQPLRLTFIGHVTTVKAIGCLKIYTFLGTDYYISGVHDSIGRWNSSKECASAHFCQGWGALVKLNFSKYDKVGAR